MSSWRDSLATALVASPQGGELARRILARVEGTRMDTLIVAAGMQPRPYSTVDAAIRAACPVSGGALDARGIDLDSVRAGSSGPWQLAARLDREARVRAVLGQLPEQRQRVLVAYAHGASYRAIARAAHVAPSTVMRWHRASRDWVAARLRQIGMLDAC